MQASFDVIEGSAWIDNPNDIGRLQVSIYGEALFYLDVCRGQIILGYEMTEDEPEMVVTLEPVAPRRWLVRTRQA